MPIDGINANAQNWRVKPLRELVQNIDVVKEEDTQAAEWAQAMAAVANVPDNVTYDMAGGSVEEFTAELEEITANGLNPNEVPESGEVETAVAIQNPEEIEAQDEEEALGIKDEAEEDEKARATAGFEVPQDMDRTAVEPDEDNPDEQMVNADAEIATDDEAIRKRKIKRGIQE